MTKLLITTQVYENYAWNEDGSIGTDENALWKAKGGNDYVLRNFTDFENVTETVMALRNQIECDNDYFREMILDWCLVDDDYITDDEKAQLEYEGRIIYPEKELS